ncbi:MAG: tetratricopeptide repeat protein [Chitinophagales bacterium]|nr:tetratricopeptide repeat protein [Chitinophagales bacterium]
MNNKLNINILNPKKMKRFATIMFAAMLGITGVQGQNSKITTAASAQYDREFGKAKQAIDEACMHEKTKLEAKTWYMRGDIHNDIARDTTGRFNDIANPADTALASFKVALQQADVKNYKLKIADGLFITYNIFFVKGANAYSAGNYEEAYTNFTKANEANLLQIDANPLASLDTGVMFNMGLMAEKTNRTVEAIGVYQKLVDMKYGEPYLYSRLSSMYLDAGRQDDALKVLDSGRKNFPTDKEIMTAELNYYLAQNKLGELVGKLENAIELDPKNAELYFVLGTTHGELVKLDSLHGKQHFDAAVTAYNKALEIDKNRFDINLNAGALFYNTAIELNKRMNVLPLEMEAEFEKLKTERNSLYQNALPYFENAHAIEPKNTDCMIALKEIYVRLGQLDKAESIKQQLDSN